MRTRFAFAVILTLTGTAAYADEPVARFREVVIDPDVGKVCYALTLADVDGDGREDIVAVTENRVLWYRQPDWTPSVIIQDQVPTDNVCIAAHDIDGDGQIDFALGAGWTGKNQGTIHWLKRGESLADRWNAFSIGAEPWLHRMRWADVLGTGREQLIISPLNATQGRQGVRLTAFEVPADPTRDRWPATVLNEDFNRMHNHWHVDLNEDQQIDTLTASREGVHLITRQGVEFSARQLGKGAAADQPNLQGAGEIRTGKTGDGKFFITTVEPMHGTMLAVYLPTTDPDALWERIVVDEGFQRGHALAIADMDGDGWEDIIFGHSDTPGAFGVSIYYSRDQAGRVWQRQIVDAGGMATEDLVVGDLTGDGRPDIVAGGRSTRNVKLYVNEGTGK